MKICFSLAILVALGSCSHVERKLAGTGHGPPDLGDLLKGSEQILSDIDSSEFIEGCVPYLTELEEKIDGMDIKKIPHSIFEKDGHQISENSWKIRQKLHTLLPEVSESCAKQIQTNFRQFRFIEDYFLEIAQKTPHLKPSDIDFQKQPIPMKEAQPFYILRTSERGAQLKFEPGDMLVTRGVSFLSGMIARLGKRHTQFSHIVWVHQDPETQKLKTIESYVGVGVDFYEMDFALKNENARILWLRAKDRSLARKADKIISEEAKKRHIKYDYTLDFDNPQTMSCAEVSQVAFELASDGKFKIPYYPNEIAGADSLIKRLKIAKGPTYEPGDMEIDPRFELMGEFQDLRITRDSRQKDAIMSAIFNWMDEHHYELHDSGKSRMAGGVIYTVRRTFLWPLVKKMLKLDEFSKEIPRNMLSTVTLINQLGEVLQKELHAKDLAYEKEHGRPMTIMDFYQTLEEFRKNDLELYQKKKTRKQSQFHKWFRPKKALK